MMKHPSDNTAILKEPQCGETPVQEKDTPHEQRRACGAGPCKAALPLFFLLSVITLFFQNTRIEVATALGDGTSSPLADFFYRLGTVGSRISLETSLLTLVFCAVLYGAFRKGLWRFSRSALLVSLLFGVFQVLGLSMYTVGSFWYLTANRFQFFLSIGRMLSTAFLMYVTMLWLFHLWDREQSGAGLQHLPLRRQNRFMQWVHRHETLACFGGILLCWLPYGIIFYPGGFLPDSRGQLLNALQIIPPMNKNPIYHTYFVGGLFWLGRTIFGSDNAGLYLYNIVQMVICALIYADALCLIRKMKLSKWFFYGSFLFFALTPVLVTYSLAVLKDPLFAAFTVLFVSQTIRLLQTPEEARTLKAEIGYLLSALPFGLCRNGALYLLLPVAIAWAVIGWKRCKSSSALKKRKAFAPCGALTLAVVCLWIMTHAMLPILGVQEGTKADMLSLPFQQTARYVRYYGKDVTPEEKAVIDTVLYYDNLREVYTPDFSDPVISQYRLYGQSNEGEALAAYAKVWAKMGAKNPQVYLEATVANSLPIFTFYPKLDAGGINYLYLMECKEFSFSMPTRLAAARSIMENMAELFASIPVLNAVNDPAVYTWLLLMTVAYLLHKRQYRRLTAFAVPLLVLVACIGAPVAQMRYMLPVCAAIPLLLAYGCSPLGWQPSEQATEALNA